MAKKWGGTAPPLFKVEGQLPPLPPMFSAPVYNEIISKKSNEILTKNTLAIKKVVAKNLKKGLVQKDVKSKWAAKNLKKAWHKKM